MDSNKNLNIALAGLFASLALAGPIASALPGDNQDLSRTFYENAARVTTPGIGWFQNVPHQVCLFEIFGVQAPLGFFYYESARVYTNAGTSTTIPPTVPPVPLACPAAINPACSNPGPVDPCAIQVGGVALAGGQFISQDALHCLKDAVNNCFAVAGTQEWTLTRCPYASIVYTAPMAQGKGTFAGTPLDGVLMTPAIHCAAAAAAATFDATAYIDTFADGSSGTSFNIVPVSDVVPNGAGDSYVISCYNVDKLILSGAPITSHTDVGEDSESHDWALVLDAADTAAKHQAAITAHLGGGNLQGLYDLSGQNGCDDSTSGFFDVDSAGATVLTPSGNVPLARGPAVCTDMWNPNTGRVTTPCPAMFCDGGIIHVGAFGDPANTGSVIGVLECGGPAPTSLSATATVGAPAYRGTALSQGPLFGVSPQCTRPAGAAGGTLPNSASTGWIVRCAIV
ncbi:MAG: hypothetical protein V4510_10605 [bacterium]